MLNKTQRQIHEDNLRQKNISQYEKKVKKINSNINKRSLLFKQRLKLFGDHENTGNRNEIDKGYIIKNYSKNGIISVFELVNECKKVSDSNNQDNNYLWYLENKISNLKKI